MNDVQMVREFIQAKGASHDPRLWRRLVHEEFQELMDALDANDEIEILDGICDLKYVINGLGISMVMNVEKAYEEVHRSNMTKDGSQRRSDGKIIKGPEFSPPDLTPFIRGYT